VKLESFYLDRFPVSNKSYKECYDAKICPDECQNCAGAFFEVYSIHNESLEDYPAVTITADGAEAFCKAWMGKRLPTEAELERAGRGPKGENDYPWGNAPPNCSALPCAVGESPYKNWEKFLHPVGFYSIDVTEEGVRDLVTGPKQLVADLYDPAFYRRLPTDQVALNPIAKQGTTLHVAKGGNLIPGGKVIYNGVSYPLPLWVKEGTSVGGVRCARSSDAGKPPIDESFYQRRQQLLSGQNL
jgi:formylglycine-generating enzyme required for sulfatase activity